MRKPLRLLAWCGALAAVYLLGLIYFWTFYIWQ